MSDEPKPEVVFARALIYYGDHQAWCACMTGCRSCTCGFREAASQAAEILEADKKPE